MLQEEQKGDYIVIFVLYSFQRTTEVSCHVRNIYTVEEKQKYHILLREKQK